MVEFPALISQFLRANDIDAMKHRIIVAVSGGADSMALLHAFFSLYERENIPLSDDPAKSALIAAHIHHGLREAADEDAAFVREEAKRLRLPFLFAKADVFAVAKHDKSGIEAAARKERYRLLNQFADTYGASYIAIAHHRDDLAETFLMNLFRGAGLRGLSGMREVRGNLIRPLLKTDRKAIEDYLQEIGASYITDESNFEDTYTRNRLRNDILPLITGEINQKAVQHVCDAALRLSEAEDYLSGQAKEAYAACRKEDGIDAVLLTRMPPYLQTEVLRLLVRKATGDDTDLEAVHIEAMQRLCGTQKGMQSLRLANGKRAVRTYRILTVTREEESKDTSYPYALSAEEEMLPVALPVPRVGEKAQVLLPNGDYVFVSLSGDKKIITNDSYTKCFDYDTMKHTVVIRARKTTDRISADRAGALTKRVTKDMMDLKVPAKLRRRVMLVACGSDVIWIPGLRYNFAYRVRENTKRILTIEWRRSPEGGTNG